MLFHWLGWASLALCALLLAKIIARKSGVRRADSALRAIHRPLGMAVIGTGALHGLLCLVKCPREGAALLSGLFAWTLIGLLATVFYARKRLKGRWYALHRALAALLVAALPLHLLIALR